MRAAEHIEVLPYELPDDLEGDCAAFLFRALDGGQLSSQSILDALSDYLVVTAPDTLRFIPPPEAH